MQALVGCQKRCTSSLTLNPHPSVIIRNPAVHDAEFSACFGESRQRAGTFASSRMDTLLALAAQHGPLLVIAATFLARLGLPVPAAPVLVVTGALGMGPVAQLTLVVGAIVANLLGDAVWFVAGRRYGYRVMRVLCRLSLSPDSCVRQSENFIARWGGSALVAAKFVPGVSTIAAPMAGALGMSTARFLAFDTVGAALWTFGFLGLGIVFSRQLQALLETLAEVGLLTGGVALALFVFYLGVRWVRRRGLLRVLSMPRITVAELRAMHEAGAMPAIFDVRSATAVRLDPRRVPGAKAIELRDISRHAGNLPKEGAVVLYCNCPNEFSAAQAASVLVDDGFTDCRLLAGGLDAWTAAGAPLETHPAQTPPSLR